MKFTNVSTKVFGSDMAQGMVRGLDPDQAGRDLVPKIIDHYQFDKTKLSVINTYLNDCWDHGMREGLRLVGPTGSGKTSIIEQIAARLNIPLVSLTAHGRMEVTELISKTVIVNGTMLTVDGPLTEAMRNGYMFLLNEVNLLEPDTATGLNDIIERGFVTLAGSENEVVRAAKGFSFVVTNNPEGDAGEGLGIYGGIKTCNLAFDDRFMTVEVGYMDPSIEFQLLKAAFPKQDQTILARLVDVATRVRGLFVKGEINCTMSTRVLLRWIRLSEQHQGLAAKSINPLHYSLGLALTNGKASTTRTVIHSIVEQLTGAKE